MGAATPAAAKPVIETDPVTRGFEVEEGESTEEVVLRVASSSDVKQLASSISFALGDSKKITLRGVGAGAVSQMVKACAIARGYVATRGVDLTCRPGFTTIQMRDHDDPTKMVDTTAVILIVQVG